jgi:hypothetical protein
MKDYITGVIVLFVITLIMWGITFLLPEQFQCSLLEMWGLVNIFIIIKTGIDIYNKEYIK